MLFVVVISMHRQSLLGPDNRPTSRSLSGNKLACPAFTMPAGIRVHNSFARQSLSHQAPFSAPPRERSDAASSARHLASTASSSSSCCTDEMPQHSRQQSPACYFHNASQSAIRDPLLQPMPQRTKGRQHLSQPRLASAALRALFGLPPCLPGCLPQAFHRHHRNLGSPPPPSVPVTAPPTR